MTLNVNACTFAGNLARDVEVRHLANDRTVAKSAIAVNRRYKAADGTTAEEVTFIDFECWGKMAESLAQHAKKGSAIYLTGRLKLDKWTTEDGQKRSRLSLVADTWQFTGGRPAATPSGPNAPAEPPTAAPVEVAPAAAGSDDGPPF